MNRNIVICGLAVTSSWGNGHATTYRSLIKGLAARGWNVLFLERDQEWYASNRDTPHPEGCDVGIYNSLAHLYAKYENAVRDAALVIVGSFVPDGAHVGEWVTETARGVTAFYDIDTPVTLANLNSGDHSSITPALIPRFHMYLSFTGGPTLRLLEQQFGSPMARPLYCSVDPDVYRPINAVSRWDLGYMATYSDDRQPTLDALLIQPARSWSKGRFMVVGPKYPDTVRWPRNVDREIHLSPVEHSAFYASQRFTLNITRQAMKTAGYSPSVRLFEAGSCGVPIISDWWQGLEEIFVPEREVLVALTAEDTLRYLRELPERRRLEIGAAARSRILTEHTPLQRTLQLESYLREAHDQILADSPRGNGRRRQNGRGMAAGMAPECERDTTGAGIGEEIEQRADSGDLQQSAGTSSGNR